MNDNCLLIRFNRCIRSFASFFIIHFKIYNDEKKYCLILKYLLNQIYLPFIDPKHEVKAGGNYWSMLWSGRTILHKNGIPRARSWFCFLLNSNLIINISESKLSCTIKMFHICDKWYILYIYLTLIFLTIS